jgi:hypothetical protein
MAISFGTRLYQSAASYVSIRVMAAQPVGDTASNIWELMKQGVNQADHVKITGEGLQSLKDDPSVQGAESNIVADIINTSKYGAQAYTVPDYEYHDDFTANGPSGNFAIGLATQNPAFLMVHSGTLYATHTTVSADGAISITWKVEDQFDYIPDWENQNNRSGYHYWAYNIGAMLSDPIYYGRLHAKSQFPTTTQWRQTICGLCK